ncbi:MAG: prealbumin-like fold domain-containing protein, partial [Acidimicrobiia bacterium]
VAVAVAVVLAATGVLAAVTLSDRGGDDGAGGSAAAGPAELTFDTISLAPGATVERAWSLAGNEGTRFEGTLTFANTTGERIAVSHTEVIPKSLAASVDDIAFEPAPVVIEADPVVRFDVDIPADGTATATYRIDVAPDGADESRLEDWADDLETEEARQADSTTTTSTTTRPTTTTTPPTTTTKPPSGGGGSGGGGGAGGGSSPKSGGGSSGGNPGGSPAATPPVSEQPPPPPPAPPPPPPTDGLIVVRALSLGGTGTFGFSGPGGSVQITTAGGPNGSGQWATGVAAGTYSWTEVGLPAGWRLSNIDCSDRDAGPFEHRSTVSGATATFNVQPGETVLCTWTNRKV